ncbi:MAG: hypothetical protein RIS24_227 [Verrucomicrobiota bacterium]|jgi:hypothetical protein
MKQINLKKRSEDYLKYAFSVRFSRAAVFASVIWFQCYFAAICTAFPYAAAGLVLAGVTLLKDTFGGETKVAYHMMIFDKTYTRKYFGVQVSDKFLMNTLHSQKMVFKHTYTLKFPDQNSPLTIERSHPWEFDYGGTELGDHQIEVRDFVCKRGGDYSGMDIDLKVSFTMGLRMETSATSVLPTRAAVTISGWNEEPSDCTGWPIYNVGDKIDWSAQILPNGQGQVHVTPNKPSFKVNRSWGRTGALSVTAG